MCYFELLEEVYQAVTSEVQRTLAEQQDQVRIAALDVKPYSGMFFLGDVDTEKPGLSNERSYKAMAEDSDRLAELFTICRSIVQQMNREATEDREYQDRLQLYKIQLGTLRQLFWGKCESFHDKDSQTQKMTFTYQDHAHGSMHKDNRMV